MKQATEYNQVVGCLIERKRLEQKCLASQTLFCNTVPYSDMSDAVCKTLVSRHKDSVEGNDVATYERT